MSINASISSVLSVSPSFELQHWFGRARGAGVQYFSPDYFRPSSKIVMRHMAPSRHPEHIFDVVSCYGDRSSRRRSTHPGPYHQTQHKSVSFMKHATTVADFTLDSTIPNLPFVHANACTTPSRSLYRFAN